MKFLTIWEKQVFYRQPSNEQIYVIDISDHSALDMCGHRRLTEL